MFVILLSFLALAAAAPHTPYFSQQRDSDIFDVNKFWQELTLEMPNIDEAISEMIWQFPINITRNEGVEGNEYKISVSVNDFDEKDLTVKAKEGVLMIQALSLQTNEDGDQKYYIELRTIPSNVNLAGSWTYDREVLKVVFPLNKKEETTVAPETEIGTTPASLDHSREEMGEHGNDNSDADVGLRGDRDKELDTNKISNAVKANTYAVDYKNEVEFLPMKYKK